jgi:large subunit ribosomal protein L21
MCIALPDPIGFYVRRDWLEEVNFMYAIFENGSKQYKVSVGDLVKVEKLDAEIGATVQFPVVMTADEKGIQVGAETEKVKVSAEVVAQGKEKKIIVFKYKAKKNERKKQGHRQPYTQIKITAIGAPAAKKTAAKKAEAEAKAE